MTLKKTDLEISCKSQMKLPNFATKSF